MTNRITHLFVLILFCVTGLVAQDDTWTKANITDEMTVSPEQNKQYKSGEYGYSSRPKNALELGLHGGHFHINGDVPSDPWSGFGVGLHVRKAINYVFSWRVGGMYSTSSGIDGRLTNVSILRFDNKGALPNVADNFRTYRTFKTTNLQGSADLIVNIGNLLFHKPRNKWNFYVGLGIGITSAEVNMNYLNGDAAYDWTSIETEYKVNDRAKRAAIKEALDDSYEATAENDRNVPGFLYNNGNIFPSFVTSMGISRKINKRVNVTLEHQLWLQDYDKWDGHKYRTTGDLTNDGETAHYTNLRVAINLGNFSKVTEPLYWLNPLDNAFNDIAELKQRPILDLTDADADGILDFLDQELNTPEGAPVDTRGVTLDSDGDGVADYKDEEPFSAPGYEVDANGNAMTPKYLTESDVNTIVDGKIGALEDKLAKSDCGNWFLPMIHFDLDKYYIKPEFYGELHHVAEVMKKCPSMCIAVVGHTDERSSSEYNNVLSYNRSTAAINYLVLNYGISRDRFTLMYGGEEKPLVKDVPAGSGASKNSIQYMNRRVEFRICEPGDVEMEKPDGPNAGKGVTPSNTSGGNKNSGY